MANNLNPELSPEELQKESVKANQDFYEILIQDIEKFKNENNWWSTIWFAIYIFIGLSAVLSSSVSAILTFLDLSNSTLLFAVALSSTASAYILTFLDPSRRASRRKDAARKSSAMLIRAKKDQAYASIIHPSDAYGNVSNLSENFATLMEDYTE